MVVDFIFFKNEYMVFDFKFIFLKKKNINRDFSFVVCLGFCSKTLNLLYY